MDDQYCCYCLVFLAGLLSHYVIASDWPRGSYGLPMAKTGCPAGASFTWETGWIYQDTENDFPQSSKSASFHIEGQVKLSSVNRSFCIKTDVSGDYQRSFWPSGTYCIYEKTGNCPHLFHSGWVTWNDENGDNRNGHQGTVPEGYYYKWATTTIYFCCRSDGGSKAIPIDLPTASPFYLFAHSSEKCQQVRWALATSEWIYYDTEDEHYNNYVIHNAPYIPPKKETGLKVYYCYYTSCQYSLNTSTGSIASPHFPANYPNGQQCSWNISVEASQIISVRFLNFSLGDIHDSLKFYDGANDAGSPLATFHGGSTPSDTRVVRSSSSNLFVVFHSNEFFSSSGFKATYATNAFSTPAPTTTKETTVETVKTTTTAQTTTETHVVTEKTRPTKASLSNNYSSKSTYKPSSLPRGNSSKNYEAFKKTCVKHGQSTLIAVAIVIPLICLITVIAMAVYLLFRLRNLREKPSDVSVRYTTTTTTAAAATVASATPESMNNPAYLPSDAVIEASRPSTDNAYEDSKGDIYDEIEPNRQATDNPLYQSTDKDKHVYASFA